MRHPVKYPRTHHLRDLFVTYPPLQKPYRVFYGNPQKNMPPLDYPFMFLNEVLERYAMATPKSRLARKRGNVKKGEYTFARVNLDVKEKKEAKAYCEKPMDEIDVAMTNLLHSGYKISFSYSESNDNVTCTFTGKPDEAVNEFRMLTSFGTTWFIALCVNLYKHWEFFGAGVWEDTEDADDFG